MVRYLHEKELINVEIGDKVILEFHIVAKEPKLKPFDKKNNRLDKFCFDDLNIAASFPSFANLLKFIFCLFHGQAAVERGFSINKNVNDVNLEKLSLQSKRLMKDYMLSNDLKPQDIAMTDGLLKSLRSSSSQYRLAM